MIGKHKTKIKTDSIFTSVKYHDTIIFQLNRSNGVVKLNSDGWNTPTTKRRINQCFSQFGIDANLYQKNFEWYLVNNKGETTKYYDNIQFQTGTGTRKEPVKMYKIVRMFQNDSISNRTIKTGLTLEQAQKHCQDGETSSSTCKKPVNIQITNKFGQWFDGYEEVK